MVAASAGVWAGEPGVRSPSTDISWRGRGSKNVRTDEGLPDPERMVSPLPTLVCLEEKMTPELLSEHTHTHTLFSSLVEWLGSVFHLLESRPDTMFLHGKLKPGDGCLQLQRPLPACGKARIIIS